MFNRGQYGLDSASAINYAAAARAGSKFQFLYGAGDANGNQSSAFKLRPAGEVTKVVAAGLDPVMNFEQAESTPTLGAAKGAACGASDLVRFRSLGFAQGSTIYISWEPGNDTSQWNNVAAFIKAYNSALDGYYVADGMYAGIPTLNHFADLGLIKHGWIPESMAASNVPQDHYWMYQPTPKQVLPAMEYLDTLVAGHQYESLIWQTGNKWPAVGSDDEDIILQTGNIGSHLEQVNKPAPIPKWKEREVILTQVDKGDLPSGVDWPGVFTYDGTTLAHVEPATTTCNNEAQLASLLGAPISISYSQYKAWGGK